MLRCRRRSTTSALFVRLLRLTSSRLTENSKHPPSRPPHGNARRVCTPTAIGGLQHAASSPPLITILPARRSPPALPRRLAEWLQCPVSRWAGKGHHYLLLSACTALLQPAEPASIQVGRLSRLE
jgi:hypothetical protein